VTWLGPECTAAQVAVLHAEGRFVVANFSANSREMDLPAMRAAIAAGVDAINVDYPRLGADAVGRPIEAKIAALATSDAAGHNRTTDRGYSRSFRAIPAFLPVRFWPHLLDPDAQVSHAAVLALVEARPSTLPRFHRCAFRGAAICAAECSVGVGNDARSSFRGAAAAAQVERPPLS